MPRISFQLKRVKITFGAHVEKVQDSLFVMVAIKVQILRLSNTKQQNQ